MTRNAIRRLAVPVVAGLVLVIGACDDCPPAEVTQVDVGAKECQWMPDASVPAKKFLLCVVGTLTIRGDTSGVGEGGIR